MKKNKEIKFRLNSTEKLVLQYKARQSGLSVSEYVRRASLGYKITAKLTEEELEIYSMLSKYSDNFRRIGNLFRQGDVTGMKETTLDLAREIKTHLKKFKN